MALGRGLSAALFSARASGLVRRALRQEPSASPPPASPPQVLRAVASALCRPAGPGPFRPWPWPGAGSASRVARRALVLLRSVRALSPSPGTSSPGGPAGALCAVRRRGCAGPSSSRWTQASARPSRPSGGRPCGPSGRFDRPWSACAPQCGVPRNRLFHGPCPPRPSGPWAWPPSLRPVRAGTVSPWKPIGARFCSAWLPRQVSRSPNVSGPACGPWPFGEGPSPCAWPRYAPGAPPFSGRMCACAARVLYGCGSWPWSGQGRNSFRPCKNARQPGPWRSGGGRTVMMPAGSGARSDGVAGGAPAVAKVFRPPTGMGPLPCYICRPFRPDADADG